MRIVRVVVYCVALSLAAPQLARAAAATCDDHFRCFEGRDDCPNADFLLGLAAGAVDGIGDLLCFVGDGKCPCFRALTEDGAKRAPRSQAWLMKIEEIVASCGGTPAGGRSLSGVAFEAASLVCTPSFAADVEPIFQASCNVCHSPPLNSGGLNLTAGLGALVGVPSGQSALPYVAPGNAQGSYLFHKVAGTQASVGGVGSSMPQGGQLPQEDIDQIRAWIDSGAKP